RRPIKVVQSSSPARSRNTRQAPSTYRFRDSPAAAAAARARPSSTRSGTSSSTTDSSVVSSSWRSVWPSIMAAAPDPISSLHQERSRALQLDAADVRLADQQAQVLADRAPPDVLAQIRGDPLAHRLERQLAALDPAIEPQHMVAETGLDRHRADLAGLQVEQEGLELRHGLAPADLPEVAALRPRRTGRELGGERAERGRIREHPGERRLCLRLRPRRRLLVVRIGEEQDVRGLEQIVRAKAPAIVLVIA